MTTEKPTNHTIQCLSCYRFGQVAVHLAKIRVWDYSLCECGVDDCFPSHILFTCPKLIHPLYDVLPYRGQS